MVSRVRTVAFQGIEAVPVDVQVMVAPGKVGEIVGRVRYERETLADPPREPFGQREHDRQANRYPEGASRHAWMRVGMASRVGMRVAVMVVMA